MTSQGEEPFLNSVSQNQDTLSPASLESTEDSEDFIFCSGREISQSKNIDQREIRQNNFSLYYLTFTFLTFCYAF